MKTRAVLLMLFFVLIIFPKNVNAQISEWYFNDNERKIKEEGGIRDYIKGDNYVIIGGSSFSYEKNIPSVTKIDTIGNVVWSTASVSQAAYSGVNDYITGYVTNLVHSGPFIYATCVIVNYDYRTKELWKINASNGNTIWRKKYNTSNTWENSDRILDYDSNKLLVGYSDGENSYRIKMAFIDKNTGDTLSSHRIGILRNRDKYALAIDSKKNIYYTKYDSVFKVHYLNPDSVIWKVRYAAAKIFDFKRIYIDSRDSIYLFGRRDMTYEKGNVVSINKNNGKFNWDVTATDAREDVELEDMIDKNNYIYATWRHTLVGGSDKGFFTTKIDKTAGKIEFASVHLFTGNKIHEYNGNGNAAMSIDVDNNGDIYLTGYYAAANYGPGCWGILKVNGHTGDSMYEATITEDSTKYDKISIGMAVCVIKNKPYFLGDLEINPDHLPYNGKRKIALVKLEGNTGNVLLKKYIGVNYQFPSKTLSIENYDVSKTIVMKQNGKAIKLEAYDFNKKLLWENVFAKSYYLLGSELSIAPNKEIFVSAFSKSKSDVFPFYETKTDSIHLFHLSSNGKIIKQYRFYIGLDNASPIELCTDNMSAIIFYQKDNIVYCRKVSSSVLSREFNLQINYNGVGSKIKYCSDKNNLKMLVFGNMQKYSKLIELDKKSMEAKNVAFMPSPLNTINYVYDIDDDNVVLCGKNIYNRESIGLYNILSKDTIWAKTFSVNNNSQVIKCVTDKERKFIYFISQYVNNIMVRKIAVSNGMQSWDYEFNGIANLNDSPTDISYDDQRKQVVITGFETTSTNNRQLLTIVLDSLGSVVNIIQKTGDFIGDNSALCSEVLPDGSIWIGGNLNKHPYGLAGFIYEIGHSTVTNVMNYVPTHELDVEVFPNPFSMQTSLCLNKSTKNIKIVIYNSNGLMVKEINSVKNEKIILNRDNLPVGLYFIRFSSGNNLITTKKVLIID